MNSLVVLFWGFLIAASVFWYGFLVFHIGLKAGKEIRELMRTLEREREEPPRGAE